MSLMDRFRRQPVNRANEPVAEQRASKPKNLRLRGQIRSDDIFPSTTDPEQ